MVRYLLMRTLVFFGALALFYLLGLRRQDQVPYLVVAAALTSMAVSYFLLRPFREQASATVAHKITERRLHDHADLDAAAEDAEVDSGESYR